MTAKKKTSKTPAKATSAKKTTKAGAAVKLPSPKVGERYEGVKDKVVTHYLTAKVGPGADPLVAFYIANKVYPTRFATTTIRWSLFCKVYKARRFDLDQSVVAKLGQSPALRGSTLGSRV